MNEVINILESALKTLNNKKINCNSLKLKIKKAIIEAKTLESNNSKTERVLL